MSAIVYRVVIVKNVVRSIFPQNLFVRIAVPVERIRLKQRILLHRCLRDLQSMLAAKKEAGKIFHIVASFIKC